MTKIIVDIYGADNSPHEIVKGCVEAININSDIKLVLVGLEDEIKSELAKYSFNADQIEILTATEVFTNNDAATDVLKKKPDSSLIKAIERLKNDSEIVGVVSAGNTGAVLTAGIFKVGRIKGIRRPALAPLLPTKDGGRVCLIDSGANVDSKPEFLVQFALMGSAFMEAVHGIKSPRVALLSNGVEDKKGNELVTSTFQLLKKLPINFVGNMEARDALSGNYDVIVTDGFAGNILLKTVEGTASLVMGTVKDAIKSSFFAKLGYALFMKKAFKKVKNQLDYSSFGGAPFLGLEKIVIKSHGSSNAEAIRASIFQVERMAKNNMVENIKNALVST